MTLPIPADQWEARIIGTKVQLLDDNGNIIKSEDPLNGK